MVVFIDAFNFNLWSFTQFRDVSALNLLVKYIKIESSVVYFD